MAKAKTGSFRLTETVQIPNATASGGRVMTTFDLGAYVNVPTGQAIAIEEVNFIWQIGTDYSGLASQGSTDDYALNAQLTDLNPGTAFVRADEHSLIASQHIDVDQSANLTTTSQDLFPDNFGPSALSEARMVVSSELFLTAGIDGTAAADNLFCTAVVKARVVKLTQSDWMAIAIQSTADSN